MDPLKLPPSHLCVFMATSTLMSSPTVAKEVFSLLLKVILSPVQIWVIPASGKIFLCYLFSPLHFTLSRQFLHSAQITMIFKPNFSKFLLSASPPTSHNFSLCSFTIKLNQVHIYVYIYYTYVCVRFVHTTYIYVIYMSYMHVAAQRAKASDSWFSLWSWSPSCETVESAWDFLSLCSSPISPPLPPGLSSMHTPSLNTFLKIYKNHGLISSLRIHSSLFGKKCLFLL